MITIEDKRLPGIPTAGLLYDLLRDGCLSSSERDILNKAFLISAGYKVPTKNHLSRTIDQWLSVACAKKDVRFYLNAIQCGHGWALAADGHRAHFSRSSLVDKQIQPARKKSDKKCTDISDSKHTGHIQSLLKIYDFNAIREDEWQYSLWSKVHQYHYKGELYLCFTKDSKNYAYSYRYVYDASLQQVSIDYHIHKSGALVLRIDSNKYAAIMPLIL